ncbi:MAG: DUF6497 family protein [Pseudomonadota bacterium]
MLRFAVAVCLCATPSLAQDVSVPSGLDMSLFDVILEEDDQTARFRFLVPAVGGDVTFADVIPDFEYLCNELAIPGLAANGWAATDIVISMSEAEIPFGTVTSEVTQFFQPFRVENDTCIWEDF